MNIWYTPYNPRCLWVVVYCKCECVCVWGVYTQLSGYGYEKVKDNLNKTILLAVTLLCWPPKQIMLLSSGKDDQWALMDVNSKRVEFWLCFSFKPHHCCQIKNALQLQQIDKSQCGYQCSFSFVVHSLIWLDVIFLSTISRHQALSLSFGSPTGQRVCFSAYSRLTFHTTAVFHWQCKNRLRELVWSCQMCT